MLDFVRCVKEEKRDSVTFKPDFVVDTDETTDILIRAGDFYAVWDEEKGLWSRSENTVIKYVDKFLQEKAIEYKKAHADDLESPQVKVARMSSSRSGSIDQFHKYCQRQMRDTEIELDKSIMFEGDEIKKEDYVSRTLPYSLVDGECPAYDEIMSTLYTPEERQKLEWAVGAIFTGDSKKIQKFIVLYGDPGSGKSTFLNIVQELFTGYWKGFDAKALGVANKDFAMEPFSNDPLVAICHDSDLSHIEDNTRINSIVSHETIVMNVKNKSQYNMRLNSFLFIGTNTPVKITNAKSGIIRRLINVSPTNNKIEVNRYFWLKNQIQYERGQIATRCINEYLKMGPHYYDKYVPTQMLQSTNDFYVFVESMYDVYKEQDEVTLDSAWEAYKNYCDDVGIRPSIRRVLGVELRAYFKNYAERGVDKNGFRCRNIYSGFLWQKFGLEAPEQPEEIKACEWLSLDKEESLFDEVFKDCPAQYEIVSRYNEEKPERAWDNSTTKLKDINTNRTHYVLTQRYTGSQYYLICIDFDIKDQNGEKDIDANTKTASRFPPTYAELSKSGAGLHLYYWYAGDVTELAPSIDTDIEIKIFTANSKASLRRRVSKCNDLPIATLSSGSLPRKEKKPRPMLNPIGIKDEQHLRNLISKALRKEINECEHTSQAVDFICARVNEMYESGKDYDIRDMEQEIKDFALNSSHQAITCYKDVCSIPYCSKSYLNVKEQKWERDVGTYESDYVTKVADQAEEKVLEREQAFQEMEARTYIEPDEDAPIVFYDVEVFINLFVICWKYMGDPEVHKMINPSTIEVVAFVNMKCRRIGFNNFGYDCYIVYAAYCGALNYQLYDLSQRIIVYDDPKAKNYNAKKLDYADIFDVSATKQSLKKWENELGEHHQELSIDWTKEVDPSLFDLVAEYCANDVIATEAVWMANQPDWKARQILVKLVNAVVGPGSKVSDSTNNLTARLIVGDDKDPQKLFVHPDLSIEFPGYRSYPREREKFEAELAAQNEAINEENAAKIEENREQFEELLYGAAEINDESLKEILGAIDNTVTFNPDVLKNDESKQKRFDRFKMAVKNSKPAALLKTFKDKLRKWSRKRAKLKRLFDWFGFKDNVEDKKRFPDELYRSPDVIGKGQSLYKGYDPGEGGFTYSVPGIHRNVTVFDVASMHPSSAIAMNVFGPYTKNYADLVYLRLAIKHGDFETARKMFGGAAAELLNDTTDMKALSLALKLAINAVYGQTYTKYPNRLKDPNNDDNVIAKRGSLFMIDLLEAVTDLGYKVVHIKTDSIKVVDADEFITNFIMEKGKEYGYTFEIEDVFEKMCLLNRAALIAKYPVGDTRVDEKLWGTWHPVADQFKCPYTFKTLFSKQDVTIKDLSDLKSCMTAFYLDQNEDQDKLRDMWDRGAVLKYGDQVIFYDDRKDDYHYYNFVGKTGVFVPVTHGSGGGYLLRKNSNGIGFSAVEGTKRKYIPNDSSDQVYRWMELAEYEYLVAQNKDVHIDYDYWETIVDETIYDIEQYGDFADFVDMNDEERAEYYEYLANRCDIYYTGKNDMYTYFHDIVLQKGGDQNGYLG